MRAFSALAALLIAALAAPATGLADAPATQEYDLRLPQAEGDSGDSGDDEAAAIAPPTSTPPTAPQAETVAPTTPDEGAQNESQGDGGSAARPDSNLFESPAPNRPTRGISTSGSGDGGFPALLLLLGAIAGTSVGFAVWRLRRHEGEPGAPGGTPGTGVSTGTQSP